MRVLAMRWCGVEKRRPSFSVFFSSFLSSFFFSRELGCTATVRSAMSLGCSSTSQQVFYGESCSHRRGVGATATGRHCRRTLCRFFSVRLCKVCVCVCMHVCVCVCVSCLSQRRLTAYLLPLLATLPCREGVGKNKKYLF